MEEEIYDLALLLIKEDYYNELAEKRIIDFDINHELDYNNLPVNFNVLRKFNKEYFNDFIEALYDNALTWAIINREKDYIIKLYNNKDNIKDLLLNNFLVQAKTTQFALKNIFKKYMNEDYIKLCDKFKNKFQKIYNDLSLIEITNIVNLTRQVLIMLLDTTDPIDHDYIIKEILDTNKYDQNIIKFSENRFDEYTLNTFKSIVERIILEDNYIILCCDSDTIINNEDDNDITFIDDELLEYIENCINTDTYKLPENDDLYDAMIDNFLNYLYTGIHNEFIDLYENEIEMKKVKKINPFFGYDN